MCPFVSADVRGGGRLRDEPKECLRRRLLFGWRYISSLHSADELQQERNSCPLLRSCFIGSCHVGVSKRFSVVSALQSFAFISFHIQPHIVEEFIHSEVK